MGLREKMNKTPALSAGLAVVAIAVAGWFLYTSMAPPGKPRQPTKAFFTVDDGKTLFEDDVNLIPPFSKDGQEAVRAYVFTCDGGKTQFVGYLEKFTDDYKKKTEAARAAAKAAPSSNDPQAAAKSAAAGGGIPAFSRLLKKPGGANWSGQASYGGAQALAVKCDDQAKEPDMLNP